MKTLPISKLHELFDLNPVTGQLFWRERAAHCVRVGDEAGTVGMLGYRMVQIGKRLYAAHRIVFAMVSGRWPSDMIDHINMVRHDNRPENLRESSRAGNTCNRGIPAHNTSGIKGVSWCKKLNKWHAYISIDKKRTHLGFHSDLELAELVVSEARAKLHGEFARAA